MKLLAYPDQKIDGKVFNAGYQNLSINSIAELVRNGVGKDVEIVSSPTDDNRSYHISSEKIKKELGYEPRFSIEDAVKDLKAAFDAGLVPDPMNNSLYYNIKMMQEVSLQ